MSRTSVIVTPSALFRRKQAVDSCEQVLVAPRAHLDHGNTGRGMRNEHREQPVALARSESGYIGSDVEYAAMLTG